MRINLVYPERKTYESRKTWITGLIEKAVDQDPEKLDITNLFPQTEALMMELCQAFCAGNWLSTIILAQATLEAELMEKDALNSLTLNDIRYGRGHVWLRNRRNAILHVTESGPSVTAYDMTKDSHRLENDARRAMELVVTSLLNRF